MLRPHTYNHNNSNDHILAPLLEASEPGAFSSHSRHKLLHRTMGPWLWMLHTPFLRHLRKTRALSRHLEMHLNVGEIWKTERCRDLCFSYREGKGKGIAANTRKITILCASLTAAGFCIILSLNIVCVFAAARWLWHLNNESCYLSGAHVGEKWDSSACLFSLMWHWFINRQAKQSAPQIWSWLWGIIYGKIDPAPNAVRTNLRITLCKFLADCWKSQKQTKSLETLFGCI